MNPLVDFSKPIYKFSRDITLLISFSTPMSFLGARIGKRRDFIIGPTLASLGVDYLMTENC